METAEKEEEEEEEEEEKEEGCGPDPVDRQHERYNAADAGMISTPITLFGQTRNLRANLSAQYSQWTHQLINTQ